MATKPKKEVEVKIDPELIISIVDLYFKVKPHNRFLLDTKDLSDHLFASLAAIEKIKQPNP